MATEPVISTEVSELLWLADYESFAKSTLAKNAPAIIAPVLLCTTQCKAVHMVPDCVYAACSQGTNTTPSSCGMDSSVVLLAPAVPSTYCCGSLSILY